jgi:hypothetical protein
MNIVTERKRFRGQFNDEEWAALTADTEFKTAWESDDFIRAGERVGDVLIGTRQKWHRLKLREHKKQEFLKAAERNFKILMDGK